MFKLACKSIQVLDDSPAKDCSPVEDSSTSEACSSSSKSYKEKRTRIIHVYTKDILKTDIRQVIQIICALREVYAVFSNDMGI